eukprot:SAG22_NODE_8250_length_671_cov_0.816434_1_plen_47_part_10
MVRGVPGSKKKQNELIEQLEKMQAELKKAQGAAAAAEQSLAAEQKRA